MDISQKRPILSPPGRLPKFQTDKNAFESFQVQDRNSRPMRISSWHPPTVQISWPLLIFMSKDTALIPSLIQVEDTFWLAPKISRACQRGCTAMSRAQATRVSNECSAWNHLFGESNEKKKHGQKTCSGVRDASKLNSKT